MPRKKGPAQDLFRARKEKTQKEQNVMDFDEDDIKRGRALAKQYKANQYALGDLAKSIETKYGENTLEEFAEAIGIPYSTLKNCRYVSKQWPNSDTRPKYFSQAKALANYPHREQYIKKWPDETERQIKADIKRWRNEARTEKENAMVDAEKKGDRKLGNWNKATERLIKDIKKNSFEKPNNWERRLDLLSQRAKGVSLGTVADLIITVRMCAEMLLKYENILKKAYKIAEVQREPREPREPDNEDDEVVVIQMPFRLGESDD